MGTPTPTPIPHHFTFFSMKMINVDKSLHMPSHTGWGFSRIILKIDCCKLVYQNIMYIRKTKS